MDAAPEIPCEGEKYEKLVVFAVISLIVYGLGIPLFFASMIWKHKTSIKLEQVMRAREMSFVGDFYETEATRIKYRYESNIYNSFQVFCVYKTLCESSFMQNKMINGGGSFQKYILSLLFIHLRLFVKFKLITHIP